MTGRPWRIGRSWAGHDGPLVTIVEEGTGPADQQGRRRDDRLVGAMQWPDAERVVTAIAEAGRRAQLAADVQRLTHELAEARALVESLRQHLAAAERGPRW